MARRKRVALIRGINVGKARRIRMEALRAIVEHAGGEAVLSIGQSGNLVFGSSLRMPELATAIEGGIEDEMGFRPRVLVLSGANFRRITDADPFRGVAKHGKNAHCWFLAREAKGAKLAEMKKLASCTERFELAKNALYLHAPDGIGRSKLAACVEDLLGVPATARNANTVAKLIELL